MALTWTDAQVTSLARIFGTFSNEMLYRLSYMESVLTTADQTAILADITAYEAIENDNVFVDAGPAGFQGNISPDKKRSLIRNRIAGLLQIESSSGSRLVRS